MFLLVEKPSSVLHVLPKYKKDEAIFPRSKRLREIHAIFTNNQFYDLPIIFTFHSLNTQSSDSTLVGGIIWENTTWTLENSPYEINETVQMGLTIEPGVIVTIWVCFLVHPTHRKQRRRLQLELPRRMTQQKLMSKKSPLLFWYPRFILWFYYIISSSFATQGIPSSSNFPTVGTPVFSSQPIIL